MNSIITFPPFHVMDGSWGRCKLVLSESTGMSILNKKSDKVVENWQWHEMSHVTIKNHVKRMIQLKKLCGVKKMVKFPSNEELERFRRCLQNSCPVKVATNMRFQRKLIILQAAAIESNPAPTFLQANHPLEPPVWTGLSGASFVEQRRTIESNVELGYSTIPPPPPPPPPMPSVMMSANKLLIVAKKKPQAETEAQNFKSNCLSEMKAKFAGGALKASQIKASKKASQPNIIAELNLDPANDKNNNNEENGDL